MEAGRDGGSRQSLAMAVAMEAHLGAWRLRSQVRLPCRRVAARPGDSGSHGRLAGPEVVRRGPGDGGRDCWAQVGARHGDDGRDVG